MTTQRLTLPGDGSYGAVRTAAIYMLVAAVLCALAQIVFGSILGCHAEEPFPHAQDIVITTHGEGGARTCTVGMDCP